MQELNLYLATNLKKFRKNKGWSLDRTAKETGVSKAMLGQIERQESSPTVAKLWQIATGLQVSLSSLIAPPTPDTQANQLRSVDHLRHQATPEDMVVATLFHFDASVGFEVFEITFPDDFERISEAHETGVIEHVIVIEGELELFINQQWVSLSQGQAIKFAADTEHGYRNTSGQAVKFHDIIHYPKK